MDFDITVARVTRGVYVINWIKPDGDSVSHVHDYTGAVQSRPSGEATRPSA